MSRERIVIDTSVLISALLSATSMPARAVERAITDGQILASNSTLRELVAKFDSRKFDRYVSHEQRDRLLQRLLPLIEIVEIVQSIRASRDPQDDQFLEVAVNGRADVLISGDGDLLALHPYCGIKIVTPATYCERIAGAGR